MEGGGEAAQALQAALQGLGLPPPGMVQAPAGGEEDEEEDEEEGQQQLEGGEGLPLEIVC